MDELLRTRVEQERDGIVTLLRTIADRLHALTAPEARASLARLAFPVAQLAHEAEPVIGPVGPLPGDPRMDGPDPPLPTTVVFVHRGTSFGV